MLQLLWTSSLPLEEQTTIRLTINTNKISTITFVGKGSRLKDDPLDDKILTSFYTVLDKQDPTDGDHHPRMEIEDYYQADHAVVNKERTIPCFSEKLKITVKHLISKFNSSYFTAEEEDSQQFLTTIFLHFLQTHKQNITCPNPSDRQRLFELYGNQFMLPSDTQPITDVKSIINNEIEGYQNLGKKFGFFNKNADRNKVLIELTQQLKPIIDKGVLFSEDYTEIARQLVLAKNKTIDSHKKNSTFGSLGLTSSRLATSLQASLNELISKGFLTQKSLNKIEEENSPQGPQKTIIKL